LVLAGLAVIWLRQVRVKIACLTPLLLRVVVLLVGQVATQVAQVGHPVAVTRMLPTNTLYFLLERLTPLERVRVTRVAMVCRATLSHLALVVVPVVKQQLEIGIQI
jgi:hypothetical protein